MQMFIGVTGNRGARGAAAEICSTAALQLMGPALTPSRLQELADGWADAD